MKQLGFPGSNQPGREDNNSYAGLERRTSKVLGVVHIKCSVRSRQMILTGRNEEGGRGQTFQLDGFKKITRDLGACGFGKKDILSEGQIPCKGKKG